MKRNLNSIKSEILENEKTIKEWEKKFVIFCQELINKGFDINCETTSHVGTMFEDSRIFCPRLNLLIEKDLNNELTFTIDGENCDINSVAFKMKKKKHICTNNNFWKKYQENSGFNQLRLGIFLIPLAVSAISSLLTLAAGAGIVAMVNSKKEKENIIRNVPKKIEDSPLIQNNYDNIGFIIYYFENVMNVINELPDVEDNEINENGFEAAVPAQDNLTLDDLIDKQNNTIPQKKKINKTTINEIIDHINDRNDFETLRNLLENQIKTNNFDVNNSNDLERLLENINHQLEQENNFENEDLEELRKIIKKKLDKTPNEEDYPTEDKKSEESEDNIVPSNIYPLWWNNIEALSNPLELKNWYYYGPIYTEPLDLSLFNYDFSRWIKYTFVENSKKLYPWDSNNLYAIYDYRININDNKGTVHVYFQEI